MNVSPIIDAVIARLKEKFPTMQIEHFPGKSADFQLHNPNGAILVSYPGSRFGRPKDTSALVQTHFIVLNATVVFRQSNGNQGVVAILDSVRQALCGYQPPNCRRKIWLMRDMFLGNVGDLWQYRLNFATESVLLEDTDLPDGSLLTEVNYEESE
ncbi:Gp37 family protein [Brenneria goodwinii]|uniref:Gp37 family protein n=1 Tax=Brenneria goodwinii TaxID=1109412 RepID=UPI0036E2C40A